MKEAFDTMAEHWCITLWLGIVLIATFSRWSIGDTTNNYYNKNED